MARKEYAPKFIEELSDCSKKIGQSLNLRCQVDGKPTPDVKWFKDGVVVRPQAGIKLANHEVWVMRIANSFRMDMSEDGWCSLTIDEVSDSDAGAYRCVAMNILGSCNTVSMVTVAGKSVSRVSLKNPRFYIFSRKSCH